MDPLSRLALRHGTDKWGAHFYTQAYHRHFAGFRGRPVRILELGVGGYDNPFEGGESLSLWRAYFPKGTVVGLDIAPKAPPTEDRVVVLQGSQSDVERLREISAIHGPFDIILDDGSHLRDDIFTSLDTLFPLMNERGVYVIEDTQTSYWSNAQGSPDLDAKDTTMGRLRDLANGINHAEIRLNDPEFQPDPLAFSVVEIAFCHNVCFLIKGRNKEPSNFALKADYPHLLDALAVIDRELERTSRTDPAIGEVIYNRSRILRQLGRSAEAIDNQKRAVAIAPNSLRQWSRLARMQAEATDWLAAAQSYRSAADISEDHPAMIRGVQNCYAEIGKLIEAAKAAEAAESAKAVETAEPGEAVTTVGATDAAEAAQEARMAEVVVAVEAVEAVPPHRRKSLPS